jgi:haloacetate dehalogenase
MEDSIVAISDYFKGFTNSKINTEDDIAINTWKGGSGKEAVLLLHGHPECHLMWRDVAPDLARDYTVVAPDIRGYGESSKPAGLPDHANYSKRVMARDMATVMKTFGIEKFHIAGHDRGGRVCHRLMLDYPEQIKSCTILDVIPTYDIYQATNAEMAQKYWHWFFFTQPFDFPEKFLSSLPEYMIRSNFAKKTIPGATRPNAFPEDVVQEYIRIYSNPATVHAICEDYRAGWGIDMEHDRPDRERTIKTPIFCQWGSDGQICKFWDVLTTWKKLASDVRGAPVARCGHFIPEEQPEVVIAGIRAHIERNK